MITLNKLARRRSNPHARAAGTHQEQTSKLVSAMDAKLKGVESKLVKIKLEGVEAKLASIEKMLSAMLAQKQ